MTQYDDTKGKYRAELVTGGKKEWQCESCDSIFSPDLDECDLCGIPRSAASLSSALQSSGGNTYGGGGAGGGSHPCYNCGEAGHISRDCNGISLDDPARRGSKSYKGRQGGQGGQGEGGMGYDEKHTGMVRSWKADRGFGFIAPDRGNGGEEIFCHISSIVDGKLVKVRSAGRERGN